MHTDVRIRIHRSQLKWIAVISMLVDHVGYIFFPQLVWLRLIGRLAFPIYAFCLAEGYLHTSDFWSYFLRMLLLACLSELPFDLAFFGTAVETGHQNVFFTLAISLLFLRILDKYESRPLFCAVGFVALGAVAELLHTDYGVGGLLMVFSFYLILKKNQKLLGTGIFALTNLLGFYVWTQWAALLALIPLGLYDGRPAKRKQRFFYWIYPLHLVVLWIAAKYLGIR